ncbi:MAG TPA: hypothetical protein PKX94_09915, partial [Opitutales bacterium]|nr:hypothetical protein [Opitutales bacterium]
MKSTAAFRIGRIVLAALVLIGMNSSIASGDNAAASRHGQIRLKGVSGEVLDAMKAKAPKGKQ